MKDNLDFLKNKYAVVKTSGVKRPLMVKLRRVSGNLEGIIQNNNSLESPDAFPVGEDDILCLFLGDPTPGVAFSAKTQPHYSSTRDKYWGLIHYYRKLADSENEKLQGALAKSRKALKSNGLDFLLPTQLEIRPNTGKMAGFWRKSKSGDSVIGICPPSFIELTQQGLVHIISHECGHPLWDAYMSKEEKAKWVKLYLKNNNIQEISLNDLKNAYNDFSSANTTVKIFMKGMEPETNILYKAIFKYIKEKHHVEPKFIDMLIDGGESAQVEAIWPSSKLHLSEMKVVLSSYANKNACEMFCESLGFYLAGISIEDEGINKRLKRTIKNLQPK